MCAYFLPPPHHPTIHNLSAPIHHICVSPLGDNRLFSIAIDHQLLVQHVLFASSQCLHTTTSNHTARARTRTHTHTRTRTRTRTCVHSGRFGTRLTSHAWRPFRDADTKWPAIQRVRAKNNCWMLVSWHTIWALNHSKLTIPDAFLLSSLVCVCVCVCVYMCVCVLANRHVLLCCSFISRDSC